MATRHRDGHTDELEWWLPCPGREDSELGSLLRSGGGGRGRGPNLHPASQDIDCATINMQMELLPRWMPFSFQHTELEVTKTKKVGLGHCPLHTVLLWVPSALAVPIPTKPQGYPEFLSKPPPSVLSTCAPDASRGF